MAKAKPNATMLDAALWAAMHYAAAKEWDKNPDARGQLTAGSQHQVVVGLIGKIAGFPIARELVGELTVGHPTTVASSSTPDAAKVLAHLLDLVDPKVAASIVATLPEIFAATGQLPDVTPESMAQAEGLLTRLRSKGTQTRRGVVALSGYILQEVGPAPYVYAADTD